MYLQCDCDSMIILGDFNVRIGPMSDTVYDCDSILERTIIDKRINQHGHEFIEFLTESKCCVLNGRCDNCDDNFTSVSRKGKAVVDYICVPHDMLNKYKYFKVITVQSIVDENSLHGLLGERSRLPDHSVICTEFETNHSNCCADNNENAPRNRYNLKKMPSDFMTSELCRATISNIITSIETARENQESMDKIYDSLCHTIKAEMEARLPRYEATRRTSKHFKNRKTYWSDELQHLWDTMCIKENDFLKCQDNNQLRKWITHRLGTVSTKP